MRGVGYSDALGRTWIGIDSKVHVDASAAKGIVERRGLDKGLHVDVNVLWMQEEEIRGTAPLRKVDGTRSPTYLMTKHVDCKKAEWAP